MKLVLAALMVCVFSVATVTAHADQSVSHKKLVASNSKKKKAKKAPAADTTSKEAPTAAPKTTTDAPAAPKGN